MSVRRQAISRITLHRNCGTCGKLFMTNTDTLLVRQVPRDGKKQAITYYCSRSCFKASYKYNMDGKEWLRRKERESVRDNRERNRKYYAAHAEQERDRKRRNYWANREDRVEDMRFNRKKIKLMGATT